MAEEQQTTIPDPQAQGGDPASAPTGEQGSGLIAGKYHTEADLDQGIAQSVQHQNIGDIARTNFVDINDKVQYYKTLEARMTQPAAAPAPTTTEPASPLAIQKPTDLVTPDMGMNEVIKQAGVSKEDIAAYFNEHGQVNPKDIAKIQKVLPGFSPTMINEHARMAMNEAKHQGHINTQIETGAAQIAGDKPGETTRLGNLLLFASSLPVGLRDSLNAQLKSPDTYAVAIHTLMRMQVESGGGAATTATQGTGTAPTGNNAVPFNNNREFSDARADKRYGPDPAYTKEVNARFAATDEHVLGS